jgi:hypothetical protein
LTGQKITKVRDEGLVVGRSGQRQYEPRMELQFNKGFAIVVAAERL